MPGVFRVGIARSRRFVAAYWENRLMSTARNAVVWVGPEVPADLLRECRQRNLSIRSSDKLALDNVGHDVRALLVAVGIDQNAELLQGPLVNGIASLRDAGVMVGLVTPRRTRENLDAINDVQARLGQGLADGAPPLLVLEEEGGAGMIAERCARHVAGPSLENVPVILAKDLDPRHERLLQRAFSGLAQARLTPLHDGLSPAKVWRVEGQDSQGRSRVPMVAKLDELARIQREIANIKEHVDEFVAPESYARLIDERCIQGATHGVLVGCFVAGARPLRDFLRSTDRRSATTMITSLFDGPLGGWRGNARRDVPVVLGRAYREWRVIQSEPMLEVACAAAKARRKTHVRAVGDLLGVLDALPPTRVQVCMSHGDLQARNVFVRDHGSAPVLIDFYLTEYESTMSRDPATLDVTLSFDRDGEMDDGAIAELYEPGRLFQSRHYNDGFRAAIEQARALCARDRVTEWEYAVSCACYLLRMARLGVEHDTIPLGRIALAYSLADSLIGWLATTPVPNVLLGDR
jgi:hypothetical protein